MHPNVARVLYPATWLLFPVGFTSFLTFHDLSGFVSGNAMALIGIANASATSDATTPVIMTLVAYFLNEIASKTLLVAVLSAAAFRGYVHYLSPYSRVSFPEQALNLKKLNILWMFISIFAFSIIVIYMLFPLANRLLLLGQIANFFVLPAFLLAITSALGVFGAVLASVFSTGMAIIKMLGMLKIEAIIGSLSILLLIFLVAYYCTSLAFSHVVLPRVSAPLSSDMPVFGALRKMALWVVGWFLRNGLDALNGPHAASIIAEVVERPVSGSATN